MRSALAVESRRSAESRAVAALLEWETFRRSTTIALYAAFRGEADPAQLEAHLEARGARAVYPRVDGDTLVFSLAWLRELEPQPPWGILEPAADCPAVALADIDLFVVPGIAFTRDGARLGYGGGFYDRVLRLRCDAARAVAFAFDCQLVHHIPTSVGDEPVDAIVTENGLFPVPSGGLGRNGPL